MLTNGGAIRVYSLVVIMVFVAVVIAGSAIGVLYETAFEEKRQSLIQTAQSQARLMEAVARYDQQHLIEAPLHPHLSAERATLGQIKAAHASYRGLGKTGEFTLARREGDQIVFILKHRHDNLEEPAPVPFYGNLAEPMRRALSKQSGTVVDLDYRGEKVLAAYEPVAVLNMGIVAKIDLSEIREPFIRAGSIVAFTSLIVITIGTYLFFHISNPIIEQLQRSKEAAEIANRAKSDLLANMSHELRTPLNAILGFTDIMRQKMFGPIENDKYTEYIDDISYSGRHLMQLINDILDVSVIESGHLELHEECLNLRDIVQRITKLIKKRADDGKVALICTIDQRLPQLYADECRVKQVLLNLLSNAIKFTPPGGRVSLSINQTANNAVLFTVSDNGIGMSDEELLRSMSKFYQVDSGLSRRHEGSGLGLPLTKELVELHGGRLDITSAKNIGTTAIVTFPPERTLAI